MSIVVVVVVVVAVVCVVSVAPRPRLHGVSWVSACWRHGGAVPATVAVTGGRIRVGLDAASLEGLARMDGASVMKLSRADLAVALASGRTGATTVAATMICAHLAGIRVFATGGIGGVHRGAESSFDISADLQELGRTPVTVVCAGAKAILDLPKTLEVLETLGVPVIAFGQDAFPALSPPTREASGPTMSRTPYGTMQPRSRGWSAWARG